MDYKGAIEAYEKSLSANPESAAAHFELGWLSDQKESDPASAIYHYNHYLRLRPNAENADIIKSHIAACKQELARTVAFSPITQSLQAEFDKLRDENLRLQTELEKWKTLATRLQALSNQPAVVAVAPRPVSTVSPNRTASAEPAPIETPMLSGSPRSNAARSVPPPVAGRAHTIKAGETPTAIARKYGLKVETLMAANPRTDARKLQPGQTLTIPAQ
jgi:LysM repeat protein